MSNANSYALLDSDDNSYAQLKILQTSSAPVIEKKASPGCIYNTLTEEPLKDVEIVILGVRKEFRVWKPEGLGKYPEYLSNDMQNLIRLDPDSGEEISYESLEESELWKNRKRNKQAKTQYYFLASFLDSPNPIFFRTGGLGFQRARRFLNKTRASGRQLYEFVTNIRVAEESTPYGLKYVPDFSISDTPVPEWLKEKAVSLCLNFINQTNQTRSLPAGPAEE